MLTRTWWDQPTWHRYEIAYGDEPGTRSRLLAESDWMTRVVELPTLKKPSRKSVRWEIRKLEREHDVFVWDDQTAYSDLWMREYRALHLQDAGRVTRPELTWDLMAHWMTTGNGLLVGACKREPKEWRAFVYFVIYGKWSYYFSSARLDDDLHHGLVWTGLNKLKDRGVTWCELGWHEPILGGEKRWIFKSGFGGFNIPAKEAPALCG